METKEFLDNMSLDSSFFKKSATALDAMPGFMELHGNHYLKQANKKSASSKDIELKNKMPEKQSSVNPENRIIFNNNVFSRVASEIHSKIGESESARLRMIACDRFKNNPNGVLTNHDLKSIMSTLGGTSKTAFALRKIAEFTENPEEYKTPEKRAEVVKMEASKKEALIKTYVATSNSCTNPYNKGVANIGELEQKFANHIKSKIAAGDFRYLPEIGVKTDNLELDNRGNIKNASCTVTVSIPKNLEGTRHNFDIPMIVKEGSFMEPLVMANGQDILPFEVKVMENVYWSK